MSSTLKSDKWFQLTFLLMAIAMASKLFQKLVNRFRYLMTLKLSLGQHGTWNNDVIPRQFQGCQVADYINWMLVWWEIVCCWLYPQIVKHSGQNNLIDLIALDNNKFHEATTLFILGSPNGNFLHIFLKYHTCSWGNIHLWEGKFY